MQILYIIIGFLVIWILALTVAVIFIKTFFNRLGKDVGKENLIKLLQDLVEKEKGNSRAIEQVKGVIAEIADKDRFHVQKVGIVKFNPFEEVGGEHSFSICLLNGNDSGFILTGLHTRDRTRVYSKEIKKGKPLVELSREEEKSLKSAVKML